MRRINVDLAELQAFACLAEARSFRAAAEQLGLTGSAVSRAIARIEDRLGARLFDRDTRNVALVLDDGAKTLRPFTFQYENDSEAAMSCLCGKPAHASDGTGLQLFALMPPLPKGTRAVDVSMPGFDVMKDVPVSR